MFCFPAFARPIICAVMFLLVLVLLLGTRLTGSIAQAKDNDFTLSLNERDIRTHEQKINANLEDPRAVFVEILRHLPSTVKVFPTENYYYFRFTDRGIGYAGNIRLTQPGITQGKVMFNYFVATTNWHYDKKDHFVELGSSDGVAIVSHSPLEFTITADGVSVRFQLNDLSDTRPPPGMLQAEETYLGPVFDESGMEFYLIYNRNRHRFLFVLNETSARRDQFVAFTPGSSMDRGLRTGFVYWRNGINNRRLLVAVYDLNTQLNNALDGPFDQLPDNFIKGEALRQAILDARPDLKGKIDRFGNFSDGPQRYLISPYLHYEDNSELAELERCKEKTSPATIEECIASLMPKP